MTPLDEAQVWRDATLTDSALPRTEVIAAWLESIEAAVQLGELQAASAWLARLEQIDPAIDDARESMLRAEAMVLGGEIELARHEPELARQRFEQARARLSQLGSASSPFDQRIELGLARALRELEQLDEAAQHGERASALGPSAAALREQARIALAKHEVERAASILRRAVSAAEADPLVEQLDLRRELAAALMLGSHWVEARGVLDEALVRAGSEAQLADACRDDLRVLFDAVIV
jgi:tetratricopeptide (TPR) repeat protein